MKNLTKNLLNVVLGLGLVMAASGAWGQNYQSLAEQHRCVSCHSVEKKVVGPALNDIRGKYRGNLSAVARLMSVIQKGGKGSWGFLPCLGSRNLNDDDALKLVAWSLGVDVSSIEAGRNTGAASNNSGNSAPTTIQLSDDPRVFGRSARGG